MNRDEQLKALAESSTQRAQLAEWQHRQNVAIVWASQLLESIGLDVDEVNQEASRSVELDSAFMEPSEHDYHRLMAFVASDTEEFRVERYLARAGVNDDDDWLAVDRAGKSERPSHVDLEPWESVPDKTKVTALVYFTADMLRIAEIVDVELVDPREV